MKTTIFYSSLVATLLLGTVAVRAQSSAGGRSIGGASASSSAGTTTSPATPNTANPGARVAQPQTGPNGAVSGNGSQIAVTNNNNNNNMAGTTNGFAGTNSTAGNPNNPSSVTATVNPLTNGFVNSNTNIDGNIVVSDQATTPSDRVLLTTISQGVKATLGITPNGNLPVHFMINNGTVTVVGTVQSAEQSQSVLAQVQQTP